MHTSALVAGIIKHQIDISITMTHTAFEVTEAQHGRRTWCDNRLRRNPLRKGFSYRYAAARRGYGVNCQRHRARGRGISLLRRVIHDYALHERYNDPHSFHALQCGGVRATANLV